MPSLTSTKGLKRWSDVGWGETAACSDRDTHLSRAWDLQEVVAFLLNRERHFESRYWIPEGAEGRDACWREGVPQCLILEKVVRLGMFSSQVHVPMTCHCPTTHKGVQLTWLHPQLGSCSYPVAEVPSFFVNFAKLKFKGMEWLLDLGKDHNIPGSWNLVAFPPETWV